MSDTSNTSTDGTDGKTAFTPPASQADLDRIVTDRLTRERAKFADHVEPSVVETLKAEHAAALTAAEQAKATAEADRDAKVAELTSTVERLTVAAEKGVPANLLTGSTKAELEASAQSLLDFRGQGGNTSETFHGSLTGLDNLSSQTDREALAREFFGL